MKTLRLLSGIVLIGLIAGYSRTVHAGGFASLLASNQAPQVAEVSHTPPGPIKYETIFEKYPEEFPVPPSINLVELSF